MDVFVKALIAVFFTAVFLGLLMLWGVLLAIDPILEDCKKKHNVYRCEIIAVPSKENK